MTPSTHRLAELNAIQAFAGIGGFDQGFQAAGIRTVAQIENDAHCQTILRRHFPGAHLMGDIRDVNGTELAALPRIHVAVAGFPCQDTSIAAPHREGLRGRRSGNYFEFTRLVEEYGRLIEGLDPRFVGIENPTGLLTSNGGRDMATVVRVLEDLGYGWAYRVVDGRHFGSPQRRTRVLVVGHRGGDPRPAWQVLGDPDPGGEFAGACDDGGQGPRSPAGLLHQGGLVQVWRKGARPRVALSKGYAGGYRETWVDDGVANTLTGFDGGLATRQTHLVAQSGRLRTFTLTEWERLQRFPDGWTEGIPAGARYVRLGNAMHAGMAEWFGRRIVAVHNSLPQLEVAA